MRFSFVTQIIEIAKILSDPTRVKILLILHTKGEMCVGEIADAVDASQSATSHQLAKLEARGVVECFRDGQMMCYELTKTPETEKIIKTLTLVTS